MCRRSRNASMTSGTLPWFDRSVEWGRMTPVRWLRVAAFGTWLVASVPAVADVVGGSLSGAVFWTWLAAFLGFGLCLTLLQCLPRGRSTPRDVILLVGQAVCALTLVATTGDGFAGAALVVVAGQLLWV